MPNESVADQYKTPGFAPGMATEGATLVSAASVTPTHRQHAISGTAEITTIVLPYPGFVGDIVFIPAAAFTLATGGNVGKAATAVAAKAMTLTYSAKAGLWYPSYVA
jgi:hypothetical protein